VDDLRSAATLSALSTLSARADEGK